MGGGGEGVGWAKGGIASAGGADWAGNQDRNEDDGGGFAAAGRRGHQLVATGLLAVVRDFLKFCHAASQQFSFWPSS